MSTDIEVTSWKTYLDHVSDFTSLNWYFRGVNSKHHALVPKIGRPSILKIHDERSEKYAMKVFRDRATPYLNLSYRPVTNLEWLTIAQHHGLPTRLLDWSHSPLVASYFAVSAKDSNEDACVYAYKRGSSVDYNCDPYAIDEVLFYRPPHISERIPAQQAAFSIHPDPAVPFEPDDLTKIIIPRSLHKTFIRSLDLFGINQATLFPSMDGIADYVTSMLGRWKWPDKSADEPNTK